MLVCCDADTFCLDSFWPMLPGIFRTICDDWGCAGDS